MPPDKKNIEEILREVEARPAAEAGDGKEGIRKLLEEVEARPKKRPEADPFFDEILDAADKNAEKRALQTADPTAPREPTIPDPNDPLAGGFQSAANPTIMGMIEDVAERSPVVQRILRTLGSGVSAGPQFFGGMANVGKTVGNLAKGDTDAAAETIRTAGQRFASTGRNLVDFAASVASTPFEAGAILANKIGIGDGDLVPDLNRPEDLQFGEDILRDDLRVPLGPMVNTGFIAGEVPLRSIGGAALDFALDPLNVTRIGKLTKAGEAARKAGALARPGVTAAGRARSSLAAQARAGQRALLRFGDTRLIKGAPVFAAYEATENALRRTVLRPFVQFRRRGLKEAADRAGAEGVTRGFLTDEKMKRVWLEAEVLAKKQGLTFDEAAERLIHGTEVGGRRAAQDAARRALSVESEAVAGRVAAIRGRMDDVLEPARNKAQGLERQADDLIADMRTRVEEMKLAEDRARNGISAAELDIERRSGPVDPKTGRPASDVRVPPGGLKPNPRKANAIKRRRKIMEDSLQDQAARLRKQAAEVRSKAKKKAEGIAKKANLSKAEAELRKISDQISGVPELPRLAGADKATRDRARALAQRYVDRGFSRFEAVRAARAVTMLGVDETMAPFAARLMGEFRNIARLENNAGIVFSNLTDPGLNYVTRVLTDEAKLALERSGKMGAFGARVREWYKRHGSTARRKAIYEGKTIPELNRWLKDNLEGFEGKLFETDPLVIARRRSQRLGQSVRTSEFFRATAEDFGRVVPDELRQSGAWVRLGDIIDADGSPLRTSRPAFLEGERIPTRLDDIKDVSVPREIADELLRYANKVRRDPPGKFLRFIDAANTLFKTSVTRAFPAFHFRNFASDAWANYLGDVGIGGYRSARRVLDDMGTNNLTWDLVLDGETVTLTSKQVFDLLERNNTVRGQLSDVVDVRRASSSPSAGAGERFVSGVERFSGGAARFTENVIDKALSRRGAGRVPGLRKLFVEGENLHRLAHFMDKVQKGASVSDAILSTKKFLFDYTDLTPFEKGVLRRVVPFYTFARKNLPLQLESLVTRPGKASKLFVVQNFIQRDEGGEEGLEATAVPPWARRRIFGFKPGDEPKSVDVFEGLGIGFEELALLDAPLDEFIAMMRPELKAAGELVAQKDSFTGLPIEDADRAPSVLRYLSEVPGGKVFLDSVGFREVKGANGEVIDFRMDPIKRRFFSLVPGLGAGSRVISTASRVDDQLSARRTPTNQILREITGLTVTSFSREERIINNMRNALEALESQIRDLKRQGFEPSEKKAKTLSREFLQRPEQKRILLLQRLHNKIVSDLQKFDKAVLQEFRKRRRSGGSLRTGGR